MWGEEGYISAERTGARPTLEVNGLLSGWTGPGSKTVLPARAMAKISCRLVPDQTAAEVEKQMVRFMEENAPKTVKWEVKKLTSSPSAIADLNNPGVKAMHDAMETVWGVRPLYRREGGSIGAVAMLQQICGVESVLVGMGLPSDNVHSPNEHMHLPTWQKGIDAFIHFFYNLETVNFMEDRIISYGGQAVIEGVMMRGRKAFAIAMRAPDGNIVLHKENLGAVYRSRIAKIPFLRGVILLWDALGLGMRALTLSANTQTGEDEKLEGPALYLTLGMSLAIGIGLFFLFPAGVGGLAEHYLGWNAWMNNLLEGVVRLILLVGYIWAIGFMPDVRRLFGYHGAEHKTINAYEAGAELTPENVAKYPDRACALRHSVPVDACVDLHPGLYRAWAVINFLEIRQPHPLDSFPGRDCCGIHPLDSQPSGFAHRALPH